MLKAGSTSPEDLKLITVVDDPGEAAKIVINNSREHRFKYRKDILIREGFDKNKNAIDYLFPTLVVFVIMFVGIMLGNILTTKEKNSRLER